MIFTIVRLTVLSIVLLGLAAVGFAQVSEVTGIVQRVDAPTGTVYFTDGRVVRIAPGSRLSVDGREVRLSDVQPGWTLVTSAPTIAPAPMVAQPSAIDVTGIVTGVDARTGTIRLQDGRVVRVTPGTTVWQPTTVGAVVPGASVYVRNAEPLDFRSQATLPAARPYQMGTVTRVDAANSYIVMNDGSIVHLRSGVQPIYNGQPLAITELRPGDEVVIGLPASSPAVVSGPAVVVPSGPAVSTLPRQALAIIEGQYVYVVRRPQAP
jgi:hypothetical protein